MIERKAHEYTYLKLPPERELRSCVGLVLAGMAARARIGVGNLDEAIDLLEGFHSESGPTRFRFFLDEDRVVAEVEDSSHPGSWRPVVELVS
ncbi:MAG: hypothetical protein K6T51_04000 [Rubrobacteraceae bacterium]|uniref:hypothetical protein n=1 Tax=Rubrobacter naiadicus TaxID=1392641 RepID=UPI0023601E8C|nr:hypothetical protein [Rubrobacter naiadicus]MBX6762237.1 hypothetical protein [Rubrobacteraceae bacterium]MCL6437751.1 hypothetical protein [Rubrobacteraceae bacterium]